MNTSYSNLPANTLPAEVLSGIEKLLEEIFTESVQISDFKIAAGGCINHGGMLSTSRGVFFIKWNDTRFNPDMFAMESAGLRLLRQSGAVRVPGVFHVGKNERYQYIIVEHIQSSKPSDDFWSQLGHQVAQLHATTWTAYGLDHDNYIGSLRQCNTPSSSWTEFFIKERLSQQLMLAEKNGVTDFSHRKKFDQLFDKISDLIPNGKPSLLHGDLWSGNVIPDESGRPVIIDPAVYFGNAEIEIAYTKLFGGFDQRFYDVYFEQNKMETGFEERVPIYNLYPLLVHANLFGKKYLTMIDEILNHLV